MTSKENPITQKAMASKLGITQAYVNKIIKIKLNKEVRKKTKVHTLSEKHKKK